MLKKLLSFITSYLWGSQPRCNDINNDVHCLFAGRPLLALEFKHMSMRLCLWIPTVDEVAEVLLSIMRREGLQLEETSVVAHSYGTAVAARILHQRPGRIKQLTLIDPVRPSGGYGTGSIAGDPLGSGRG